MGSSPLEYARLRARSLAPLLPRFKWQVCSTSIVSPSRTEMKGPEKSLAKAGSSNYTHEDASWSAHTRSSTFVLWGVSAPTNVRLFVSSFTMTRKHSPEARRRRLGSQDRLHSRFVRSKVTLLRS